VLVLLPEDAEISEHTWLHAAAANPAFEFLILPQKRSTLQRMGSRSMMRGKVVLVPFPFDDLSATRVRPVEG
jgi:hypothetical protein